MGCTETFSGLDLACGPLFTQPCLHTLRGYSGCCVENRLKQGTTGSLVWKMWWLTFMCQLDWATGYLEIWSSIILGVSGKMFLGEMNIWIGGLRKADCPAQCEWVGLIQSVEDQTGTESLSKQKLLVWLPLSLVFCCLWTQTETLGLQLADWRYGNLASIIMWAHSYNESLTMYTDTSY